MSVRLRLIVVLTMAAVLPPRYVTSQASSRPPSSLFSGLQFRNIGPAAMGGRIDDFAVLESNPAVFYVAAATGGLWKTTNNGTTWEVPMRRGLVLAIVSASIVSRHPIVRPTSRE